MAAAALCVTTCGRVCVAPPPAPTPTENKRKSSAEGFGPCLSIKYNKVGDLEGQRRLLHFDFDSLRDESFVLAAVQVTLSGRDVEKGFSVRTLGVQVNAIPSSEAEGLSHKTLCVSLRGASSLTLSLLLSSRFELLDADVE